MTSEQPSDARARLLGLAFQVRDTASWRSIAYMRFDLVRIADEMKQLADLLAHPAPVAHAPQCGFKDGLPCICSASPPMGAAPAANGEAQRYHVVSQLDADSWIVRVARPEDAPNCDDLWSTPTGHGEAIRALVFVCDGCGKPVKVGPGMSVYHNACDEGGHGEALRALRDEWRKEAKRHYGRATGTGETYEKCADDLDALLSAPLTSQTGTGPELCDYENESEGSFVAFRCGLPKGHDGPHGANLNAK